MTFPRELLDELLKGCERAEDLLGEAGLMKGLKIKLIERMPDAEIAAHPLPGRALRSFFPKGWAM
jgi:hypothetical protein